MYNCVEKKNQNKSYYPSTGQYAIGNIRGKIIQVTQYQCSDLSG